MVRYVINIFLVFLLVCGYTDTPSYVMGECFLRKPQYVEVWERNDPISIAIMEIVLVGQHRYMVRYYSPADQSEHLIYPSFQEFETEYQQVSCSLFFP